MPSAELCERGPFFAVARMSARKFAAYPADVITEFMTYPVVFLGYFFFLQALSRLGGSQWVMPLEQLTLYYSLGWILRMVFHQQTDLVVSGLVAEGDIALQLVRPMDFSLWLLAQALGCAAARLLFYAVPGAVVLLVLARSGTGLIPASPWLFMLTAVIGFLILFELQLFIGGISFFTTMNYQISWTLDMTIRLVAGLVVPLTLLPAPLQAVLQYLPFPHIYSYPIQAWTGQASFGDGVSRLAGGLLWVVGLYCINRWFFQQAFKRLNIYGG